MGFRSPAYLLLLAYCALAFGQTPFELTSGQVLYLPVYSHVWHGDVDNTGKPFKTLVSTLVSIRNTDPVKPIRLTSARYYDTDGKQLQEYVSRPLIIKPMGTHEIYVSRDDDRGGSGANFLIAWRSDTPVNPPLVEAIHMNLPAGRSIVFTTSARPIKVE